MTTAESEKLLTCPACGTTRQLQEFDVGMTEEAILTCPICFTQFALSAAIKRRGEEQEERPEELPAPPPAPEASPPPAGGGGAGAEAEAPAKESVEVCNFVCHSCGAEWLGTLVEAKWIRKWRVPSHREGGGVYVVAQADDGTYGCSCPAWKFRRIECKHIRSVKLAPKLYTPIAVECFACGSKNVSVKKAGMAERVAQMFRQVESGAEVEEAVSLLLGQKWAKRASQIDEQEARERGICMHCLARLPDGFDDEKPVCSDCLTKEPEEEERLDEASVQPCGMPLFIVSFEVSGAERDKACQALAREIDRRKDEFLPGIARVSVSQSRNSVVALVMAYDEKRAKREVLNVLSNANIDTSVLECKVKKHEANELDEDVTFGDEPPDPYSLGATWFEEAPVSGEAGWYIVKERDPNRLLSDPGKPLPLKAVIIQDGPFADEKLAKLVCDQLNTAEERLYRKGNKDPRASADFFKVKYFEQRKRSVGDTNRELGESELIEASNKEIAKAAQTKWVGSLGDFNTKLFALCRDLFVTADIGQVTNDLKMSGALKVEGDVVILDKEGALLVMRRYANQVESRKMVEQPNSAPVSQPVEMPPPPATTPPPAAASVPPQQPVSMAPMPTPLGAAPPSDIPLEAPLGDVVPVEEPVEKPDVELCLNKYF